MKLAIFVFAISLPLSAASEVRILSECGDSAEVKATLAQDAAITVLSSLSNGSPCFSVTANVDGKQVRGYITDKNLDAVAAFEKSRVEALKEAMTAEPYVPPPPPDPPVVKAPAKPAAAEGDTTEPAAAPAAPAPPKRPARIPI